MVHSFSKYKSYSNFAWMTLAFLAIVMAWMASRYEYSLVPILATACLAILFTVIVTLKSPIHGFLLNLVICFFIFLPQRILELQYSLSIIWEIHLLICFFAAVIPMKGLRTYEQDIAGLRNPVTIMMIISFLYFLVQFFNPNTPNHLGWISYLRREVSFVFIFFSAFLILKDIHKIRAFLQTTLALILLSVIYAYWQQGVGLPPWDENYINQSSLVYNLHVQWGLIRKFSFLDVVIFPMFANLGALILIIFAIYEKKTTVRVIYLGIALFILVGATFSGTRSASYILPAGLLLYTVLNLTKPKTLLIFAGLVISLFVVVNLPIHRFNTLNRFRSSFTSDDASLEVRNINRARIQPYIYEHPIGGGLMSTGAWGEKFYPEHPLAKFPPDSGLLASALEKGWIGLGIDLLLYLMILIQGTKGYFRTPNKHFKKYYMSITCGVFSLVLVEYAQEVIPQIPVCIFFMSSAAIIVRLRQLDNKPETLSI